MNRLPSPGGCRHAQACPHRRRSAATARPRLPARERPPRHPRLPASPRRHRLDPALAPLSPSKTSAHLCRVSRPHVRVQASQGRLEYPQGFRSHTVLRTILRCLGENFSPIQCPPPLEIPLSLQNSREPPACTLGSVLPSVWLRSAFLQHLPALYRNLLSGDTPSPGYGTKTPAQFGHTT